MLFSHLFADIISNIIFRAFMRFNALLLKKFVCFLIYPIVIPGAINIYTAKQFLLKIRKFREEFPVL